MFKPKDLTDNWFFSKPNILLRILHIYVKGDAVVILPLCLIMIITGIFSWQFMLIEIGIFLTLRGIGEMFYWILEQFGNQTYRPETPFKGLSNNAVYILYQLSGMITAFIGGGLVIFTILYCY